MITTRLLRHINARRCLRLLHNGRRLSRAEMARELGLTRATSGNAMRVLLDAGLVVEANDSVIETRKGRPGVAVALNPSGAFFVGIDIGTRSLNGILLDLQMNVVTRIVEHSGPRFRDPEHMTTRALAMAGRLIENSGIPRDKVEGVCISVPGLVAHDGSVVNAPFLEWRNYPLRDHLVKNAPVEWSIMVCNDAFAFANAELAVSEVAETDSLLLVLLAEGIGGAIVEDGRVMTGARGYSGEIGHMIVTAGGRTDTFEMLAGAKAFARFLKPEQSVAEGVHMLLGNSSRRSVGAALEAWANALSAGLTNAIHLLDPGRIVLGGPLAALYPHVSQQMQSNFRALLLPGLDVPQVQLAHFGADGAAIGAAATIRETIFALPDLDASTADNLVSA